MEIIRKTKLYHLNKGDGQARGLYNVSSSDEEVTELSLWFDNDMAKELKKLPAKEFNARCKQLCKE